MHSLVQDLRFAARALGKSPGFAAAATVTLALGIGATAAIFTVVNGVLLRPLPYADPGRIAMVWMSGKSVWSGADQLPLSAPNFVDLRERARSFERLAAFRSASYALGDGGEPELLSGARVSDGFFGALGVRPLAGRAFSPEEERPGAGGVVVLGYALWQRKFGGEPSVVGRRITLSGEQFTVVGVMPREFTFPRGAELPAGFGFGPRTELWTPLALSERDLALRGTANLAAVGRLRAGVARETAQAELAGILAELRAEYPRAIPKDFGVRLLSLRDQAAGPVRGRLLVLMGAVLLVLVIACANVANLLVARTAARRRELAIRASLGAARARLVRQLLTEAVVLAVAGAALGMLLAVWGTDALLSLVPSELPRADDVAVDARVVAVTMLTALGAGLAFGAVAAAAALRPGLADALRDGGVKATGGPGQRRLRQTLVVGEIALSLVLLVGAGLLAGSFARLERLPPGFESRNALSAGLLMRVGAEFNPTRDGPRWASFFTRYVERLAALPGVRAVGGVSSLPLSGDEESAGFRIDGRPAPLPGASPEALYSVVTPDYFRAIGIPLREGRAFSAADRDSAPPVVVISEAVARAHWPGESPLGHHITMGLLGPARSYEIVGVVGDVRQTALERTPPPSVYLPVTQVPSPFLSIVIRTAGDPSAVVRAARRELRALDPSLALSDVRPLEAMLSESLAQRRFSMTLLGFFAAAALALAVVGLYGVIAYSVAQRTREIGVRAALGAQPRDAMRLVMRDGVRMTAVGLGVGVVGALAVAGVLRGQLYELGPADPATYAAGVALLGGVALLASYLPARRAARVDPMDALRYE